MEERRPEFRGNRNPVILEFLVEDKEHEYHEGKERIGICGKTHNVWW